MKNPVKLAQLIQGTMTGRRGETLTRIELTGGLWMKKAIILIVLVLLAIIIIFSQEYKGKGRVVGVVVDEEGNPVEGVRVKLVFPRANDGFEVQTDSEGKWVAAWIRSGGWNIDFEKFGFAPKKISLEVQEYSRNPEIKVTLKKVEGLVITEDLKKNLMSGNQLFEEKKYGEAAEVFKEILVKFPDAFVVNKNIGNCYFQQEKYEEAEEFYKKILEKDPKNSDAFILIGNTYMNRGEQEKALEWYGQIEFDKIDDQIVLYNIGTNYYNTSKFEEALKCYKRAVDIQKDFPDALYQLGLTYLNLGSNTESISAFENYLKLDADSQRASQVKSFLDFLKK